ncbi:hypothetical protein DPMN_107925 [Dreissena polymorpha]|uniref:Uncharacterized protein n=1 Tax=Dreissena polymorpha TaxID=45954 RepID=A0A9D4K7X0_DREPO|nr:hypothetical protein DPMN_107925 [Dreissena polymorpha]
MVVNIDFSELLPIAKSLENMRKICVKNEQILAKEMDLLQQRLEDMQKICVKNEKTLVKEMDLLQQDITQREEEIKQLKSCSNKDRNKWQRE